MILVEHAAGVFGHVATGNDGMYWSPLVNWKTPQLKGC